MAAYETYAEAMTTGGLHGALQSAYDRWIRSAVISLFGRRLSVVNGVAMRRQAVTDFTRIINLKSPMYTLIRDHVSPGDHVVDIAAGRGGFAVKAAMNGATVDTYEAAENMAAWARETIAWNAMDHRVTLHHALISETTAELYGPTAGAESIPPADLPSMGGLVLDCEGAELGIIGGLTEANRPSYVIVETHPEADNPATTEDVTGVLENAGYSVSLQMDMTAGDKNALLAREADA